MRKVEGGSSQFTTNTLLLFTQQVWEYVVAVRVLKVLVVVYDLGEVGVSEVLVELAAGEEVYLPLVSPLMCAVDAQSVLSDL